MTENEWKSAVVWTNVSHGQLIEIPVRAEIETGISVQINNGAEPFYMTSLIAVENEYFPANF